MNLILAHITSQSICDLNMTAGVSGVNSLENYSQNFGSFLEVLSRVTRIQNHTRSHRPRLSESNLRNAQEKKQPLDSDHPR